MKSFRLPLISCAGARKFESILQLSQNIPGWNCSQRRGSGGTNAEAHLWNLEDRHTHTCPGRGGDKCLRSGRAGTRSRGEILSTDIPPLWILEHTCRLVFLSGMQLHRFPRSYRYCFHRGFCTDSSLQESLLDTCKREEMNCSDPTWSPTVLGRCRNEVPWPSKSWHSPQSMVTLTNLKDWRHTCNRDFLWDCLKWDHWKLKCKWWNRPLQNKYHIQSELYQMQNLLFALPFKTSAKA